MDPNKLKMCYVVTEGKEKSYWNRIGVAFVNKDGSLTVRLNAVPVSGEIQIRDYIPPEERGYSKSKPSPEIIHSRPKSQHDTEDDMFYDDIPFK